MSDRITLDDIKHGDKLRIIDSREIIVGSVNTLSRSIEGSGGGTFREGNPADSWVRHFELIERPLPPLPTEIGSVIEVTNANPFEDNHQQVTRWFLRESRSYPKGMWQGTAYNSGISFDEMQKFIELHGGFEVLL